MILSASYPPAALQGATTPLGPFVVEAAGIGVRAVDTAFNVRVHPEAIEVLVTEGTVRVALSRAVRVRGLKNPKLFLRCSPGWRVLRNRRGRSVANL